MPLEYDGVVAEHTAVREKVGLFDVSHLGTLHVHGPLDALNAVLTNDLTRVDDGYAQYTLLLNDDGGVIDDVIVYRINDSDFIVVPNAANNDVVAQRFESAGLTVSNEHRSTAILALQGPGSDAVLERLEVPDLEYMQFAPVDLVSGQAVMCRTGYTGERGVELLVPAESAPAVWDQLIALGAEPCGLGARDTLRTEMGYSLHGQDLRPDVLATESGVGWAIAKDKPAFDGRDAIVNAKPTRKMVGLRLTGRGVPRPGMSVLVDGSTVGVTTSGTFSPTLGSGIALARVDRGVAVGDAVVIEIRGRSVPAEVIRPPFVPSRVRG